MVRIALGQIDPSVGDLEGNVELMTAWTSRATEAGADVVVFPELAITGYPPEDLVLRPAFVDDNLSALEHLAKRTAGGCSIVTGFVDRTDRGLHNAAALVANGEIVARYHKVKLPNYGVFDEQRTFVRGAAECAVRLAGSELGLSVCEDAWAPGPPFDAYAARKTPIVLNINGSPYHRGKAGERIEIARDRALETGAWIVYVNTIGGQDELVFDGGSMVVAPDGTLRHRA
jgi:NAD+ synthase (glutamine-hydrolysing)